MLRIGGVDRPDSKPLGCKSGVRSGMTELRRFCGAKPKSSEAFRLSVRRLARLLGISKACCGRFIEYVGDSTRLSGA